VSSDGAINAEHINVVAQNLKIVAGVIFREQTFVVQHGLRALAVICRWQPKQVGVHEVWQE